MHMSNFLPHSHISQCWKEHLSHVSSHSILKGHIVNFQFPSLNSRSIFLYFFQHLIKGKRHIFYHKYSPWTKQWIDWHGEQPLLSHSNTLSSLPVIHFMLCGYPSIPFPTHLWLKSHFYQKKKKNNNNNSFPGACILS